jgi:hypothetical protein
MNRLSFLKKLGIGAVAVAVAPKVIAEIKEKKTYPAFNHKLIDKRIAEIKTSKKLYLKYWYPHNLPKVWSICYNKDITKKYRVIGIRKDQIFLAHFTDKWASLPFEMGLKDFCNNFLYLIEIPTT